MCSYLILISVCREKRQIERTESTALLHSIQVIRRQQNPPSNLSSKVECIINILVQLLFVWPGKSNRFKISPICFGFHGIQSKGDKTKKRTHSHHVFCVKDLCQGQHKRRNTNGCDPCHFSFLNSALQAHSKTGLQEPASPTQPASLI